MQRIKALSTLELFGIAVMLIAIVLSMTVGRSLLSSPEFYAHTIETLEEQKNDALMLSAAVTVASTAISAIPDDTGSSIADQLADLTLPLFIIVATIYLEIYLLTTFGWVSSTVLLPVAFVLCIGYIASRKAVLRVWIKRILILAIALLFVIPFSTVVTSNIEETFDESINQKFHSAAYIVKEAEEQKDGNAVLNFFSGLADSVTSAFDLAKNMLSAMIDAIAILVITSIVIPIITVIVFLQAVKAALCIDIPMDELVSAVSSANLERRSRRERRRMTEQKSIEK